MRCLSLYSYYDNYFISDIPAKSFPGKNSKSRFPVKIKRNFPAFIERRNSSNSKKTSVKFNSQNLKLNKISKGSDQIVDCIFYYANGIIQMAIFPKSAN